MVNSAHITDTKNPNIHRVCSKTSQNETTEQPVVTETFSLNDFKHWFESGLRNCEEGLCDGDGDPL